MNDMDVTAESAELHEGWLSSLVALADPAFLPLVLIALGIGLLVGLSLGGSLSFAIASRIHARRAARLDDHLSDRMRDTFHALSSEALDRSSDRLLTLAGERFGALERAQSDALLREGTRREETVSALVRPIRESLLRVDEKLQHVEAERQGQHASLTKHLELIATSNRNLERETQNLSQALRTPNARGRWGELQLQRVVELAGMLEHCDFEEQPTLSASGDRGLNGVRSSPNTSGITSGTTDDSLRVLRPDLIVRLPGNRTIAVDSKAPLQEYLAAAEAADEETRAKHLAGHAKHVRRHIDDLGARAYWSRLDNSPEFVVLFLPGEPFFAEALAEDPELIERGIERKVLMAGPTTLIGLLRAVAYGWQQEAMAENAAAICSLGRELFDRVVTLNEHFGKLGQRLDGAVEAYNGAMGSFESRVQVTARQMARFGIANSDDLSPPRRLDRSVRSTR